MKNSFTKYAWLLSALVVTLACSFSVNVPVKPTEPPIITTLAPATLLPAPSETSATAISGMDIAYLGMSFTIPSGLANGTQNDVVPPANDYSVWPAHTRFILQGYPLQGTVFDPQILIFPVKEFTQMSEDAGGVINALQSILTAQKFAPTQPIPFLPNQHAQQVLHVQEKFLSFKNGSGIRFVTQYDQAPLPINNASLFYTFQGLTSDGNYYISVILPVNLPYLSVDDKLTSIAPPDGVQFNWENPELFPAYLQTMTERLNQTNNRFTPTLATLDGLVQSIVAVGQK